MRRQKRSVEEFTAFVKSNGDVFWHICKDFSFSTPWDAEDAYQEILSSLWQSWHQAPGSSKRRKAWACRVAYSTLLHIKRQYSNQPGRFIPFGQFNPAISTPDYPDESDLYFAQLIGLLPQGQQEVVKAFYDGFSFREIAQMLNISEVAVRQRHSRAIRKLKQLYYEQNI